MNRSPSHQQHSEAHRVEMFSDGVFAIAITLLVLELIQVTHPESGKDLPDALLQNWHSFVAFGVGFVTILVCWINHHIAMASIRKVDTAFLWINGSLLFVVTLAPLSTAILAAYMEKDSANALALFSFNYILMSIAADAICSYAYTHKLVDEERLPTFRVYKRIYRYAVFYNVIALALCYVSIVAAIAMNALLFVAFAAPETIATRLLRSRRKRVRIKTS